MQEEKQIDFDFNEILNQFRSGKRLTGKDGLLAPLIKQLTEAALALPSFDFINDFICYCRDR